MVPRVAIFGTLPLSQTRVNSTRRNDATSSYCRCESDLTPLCLDVNNWRPNVSESRTCQNRENLKNTCIFDSRCLSNPPAGLRLHVRAQQAHNTDHGRQTEDNSGISSSRPYCANRVASLTCLFSASRLIRGTLTALLLTDIWVSSLSHLSVRRSGRAKAVPCKNRPGVHGR